MLNTRPPLGQDLLTLQAEGIYCPRGDFYIDPWRPVKRAVITHGHGDHARSGMAEYFCTEQTLPILQWRLGEQHYHAIPYGEPFRLGDATLSFHSAGHVLGSAQVRVEVDGEVWVASGDYKRQEDPTCEPFEVVRCDTFITEATFALPIYCWQDTAQVAADILAWKKHCADRGEAAIIYAYALGKAQRILGELNKISTEPAWLHGAIHTGVEVYRQAGIPLLPTHKVSSAEKSFDFAGQLIIAPPSAAGSPWLKRFKKAQHGFASGWMQIRGNRRRRNYDRGFVISDHVDWYDLIKTIKQTGASRIIATHGDTEAIVRYLRELQINASGFTTHYEGDD